MCWSVWPDTVLRRCLILSHPSIIPVDMKRCVYALVFLYFFCYLCCDTPSPPCLCPQVVTPLVWNKPDIENSVPLWIIILAILAGLLLLALLIYVLYKVSETQKVIWDKLSPLKPPAIGTCFLICSLDSSSDQYPTTWPWRKHKSSPSLKPSRGPAMTISGKTTAAKEAEEQIWSSRRAKERPLELHCAALDEDKTVQRSLNWMNVCFFLFFYKFPFLNAFFFCVP